MNGTVKIYFINRGYGFITGEDGEEYYFHISDSNLDFRCRYRLDGAAVKFTSSYEVINGAVKKRAREVMFELGALMMDQRIVSPDEVSALITGKVVTGFKMEDMESTVYKMYTLTAADPETGAETVVSFTGL